MQRIRKLHVCLVGIMNAFLMKVLKAKTMAQRIADKLWLLAYNVGGVLILMQISSHA